ncbi:MAG: M28 family peptidase [Bacteroidales bacterium]|nr:M28 family peptidase [Bacteroidales bacterium]
MKTKIVSLAFIICCVVLSCSKKQENSIGKTFDYSSVKTPEFSVDSAYYFVEKQCSFGPRIPESKAAEECGDWIIAFLQDKADTVYIQEFTSSLWNGREVKGRNIIASFNLEATERVLLSSHWDSRMWADHDKDSSLHHTPLLGANDGASGVGVLLEIARIVKSNNSMKQGLDIVLFDLEDQGAPQWADDVAEDQSDWCLGSQHWAKNLHIPYYNAKYGILLDMVGSSDIRFTKEYASMSFAPSIMNNVWKVAKDLGFGNIFIDSREGSVMDDHIFINRYANIPTIDIVQNSADGSFFPYWHTTKDNMDCIDKASLGKVGKVLLTTFFAAEQ